jgi:hypothetical protein
LARFTVFFLSLLATETLQNHLFLGFSINIFISGDNYIAKEKEAAL